MSAVRRRIAVIITLFAAMLAMPALTTSANAAPAGYGGGIAGVSISASAVGQGCSVTISGTNFFGTVTFSGSVSGTAIANADGDFSKSFDTSGLSQGQQNVVVSDTVGDSANVSFTVTSKASACSVNNGTGATTTGGGSTNNGGTGGLSNTGVAVIGIGTVGGILLAGGALMLVAGRRRKVSA